MGLRGPTGIPTKLKLLEGNPSKRPLNAREPTPAVAAPTCPAWLSPEARSEWRRIVPELLALGVLAKVDRGVLTAYCATWAQWREMFLFIREHGVSFITQNGYPTPYPEVRREETLRASLLVYAREWGMTASARSRIEAPLAPQSVDLLEQLLSS